VSVTKINPPTLMPPLFGLYAQAVVADVRRLAFIAGQVAFDADGVLVGGNDYAAQARQAFLNLKNALAAIPAAPANVVRMTIYVVNHRPELVATIFDAGREVFGADWPVTSSVLIGVQALAMPEWLVEVDAIAAL
jgi:enamine deaminase RidA (YjgF/YER057c/UK114 family)